MADKTLVFLLHGMGVHKEGWSTPVQEALNTHAQTYAFFKTKKNGKDIADLVDFHELVYDNVFETATTNWDKQSRKLLEEVAPEDKDTAERAVGWLDGMGKKEDNFAWTHAVDVLLWRFSSFVRNTIKTQVAAEVTREVVERSKRSDLRQVRCMMISHSLGTAVAHDTLADIAAGRFTTPGAPINGFHPKGFRFAALHTIANVSKILELDGYPVYSSRIRPGPNGDDASYCVKFFNYHNKFDPFTVPRPFEPDWPVQIYNDKAVSHLYDKNPHAIEHYLLNPKVHAPMLRSIMGDARTVTSAEETEAIRKFKQFQLKGTEAAKEKVRKKINDAVESMGKSMDMIDFVKGIQLFFGEKP